MRFCNGLRACPLTPLPLFCQTDPCYPLSASRAGRPLSTLPPNPPDSIRSNGCITCVCKHHTIPPAQLTAQHMSPQ